MNTSSLRQSRSRLGHILFYEIAGFFIVGSNPALQRKRRTVSVVHVEIDNRDSSDLPRNSMCFAPLFPPPVRRVERRIEEDAELLFLRNYVFVVGLLQN